MFNIPIEIWNFIFSFLYKGFDLQNARSSCKFFKKICDKNGYIKFELKDGFSKKRYFNLFEKADELKELRVVGIKNPWHWVSFPWPERVSLVDCEITEDIDPPISKRTKYLHVDSEAPGRIKINWEKFPNLKRYSMLNTMEI